MKTSLKYAKFGEFLRGRREEKFRSAREYCARVKVNVSYPQYSRYEAGEQLPSLLQALLLARALEIPPLQMILNWNLAQLEGSPEHEQLIRELEEQFRGSASRSAPQDHQSPAALPLPLDDVIVFNRSHRALFMKDEAFRDIFTYVNAIQGRAATVEEISRALRISPRKIAPMLEQLVELGVIQKEQGEFAATKKNFYFPDDEDFFELRHRNLKHNLDQLLGSMTYADLAGKKAFRSLVTRELTERQFAWTLAQVDAVLGKIVDLPEDPEAQTVYSICAVVGERFRTELPVPIR